MNDNDVIRNLIGKANRFEPVKSGPVPHLADTGELVGVEIELENWRNCPENQRDAIDGHWDLHDEGSIINGREFVLHPPLNGEHLRKAIDVFFDSQARYDATERTSIHVHLSMTDGIKLGQFRAMMALIYLVEPAIFRAADENRKWCSYCCPLTDMPPERWLQLMTSDNQNAFINALKGDYHEEKYYGCNVVSLRKHGTIEFRYFPCTRNKEVMFNFINICMEMKKTGMKFDNIPELLAELGDREAVTAFINKHMLLTGKLLLPWLDFEEVARRVRDLYALLVTPKVKQAGARADVSELAKERLARFGGKVPARRADRVDIVIDEEFEIIPKPVRRNAAQQAPEAVQEQIRIYREMLANIQRNA